MVINAKPPDGGVVAVAMLLPVFVGGVAEALGRVVTTVSYAVGGRVLLYNPKPHDVAGVRPCKM